VRRLALILLSLSMFAAACGADRPTFDDSASREVDPDLDDTGSSGGTDVVSDTGPLTLRLAIPPGLSLDPAAAGPGSLSARVLSGLLYEGLTRINAAGEIEAGLAERWFISDDRLTWTFILPSDLTDGAGALITARDVKLSLERIAVRGPTDQAATALRPVMGWDDLMNGDSGGAAGIVAPDPTTVVIRLDTVFELLPNVLAAPAYGITGENADGSLRTTGEYRTTAADATLVAVDEASPVATIELLADADGSIAAISAGTADWAVLAADDNASGLAADVIRQPLDLEVAIVARMAAEDERLGVLGSIEPLLLADALDAVTARAVPGASDPGVVPPAVLLDLPAGPLEPLGRTLSDQLRAAGIEVVAVTSEPGDFAARLADGGALVFPVVIAGGIGPSGGILRLATPGGVDDAFGADSVARAELAAAVATERDPEQRTLFAAALERALIDDGYLLPVGRFEVRVAIGDRLAGLRHAADGTLDLTSVRLAS
jgi:Bacterial extracellular solute-binding proteins, family 5 Middle